MVVTWSDLAKHCPWSKGQPIGNGIYCAPWHSASSYPIPQKGNGILLLCGFIFAIIIIIDVVVVVKVFVLNNGDISLIFQDISMKLGGHIGHGAIAHIIIYDIICHAVIEL